MILLSSRHGRGQKPYCLFHKWLVHKVDKDQFFARDRCRKCGHLRERRLRPDDEDKLAANEAYSSLSSEIEKLQREWKYERDKGLANVDMDKISTILRRIADLKESRSKLRIG